MKTIDQLWAKLKDVELVQVRPSEMEAIYRRIFEFEERGAPLLVEIGSAHGASSIILAEAARELGGKLYCIDHFPEDYYAQEKFGSYAKVAFLKNLFPEYEKEVTLIMEPSTGGSCLFC
jgi:cephalosporin hydroxylase